LRRPFHLLALSPLVRDPEFFEKRVRSFCVSANYNEPRETPEPSQPRYDFKRNMSPQPPPQWSFPSRSRGAFRCRARIPSFLYESFALSFFLNPPSPPARNFPLLLSHGAPDIIEPVALLSHYGNSRDDAIALYLF